MTHVSVNIELPYRLPLPDGQYGEINVDSSRAGGGTEFSSQFVALEAVAEDHDFEVQRLQAERLLHAVNRLLRWYRYLADDATATELTAEAASPFRFQAVTLPAPWGPNGGEYTVAAAPAGRSFERSTSEVAAELRERLLREAEPPVWHLLVLDADVAASEARYREAVLLSWSAIESCFSTTYEQLVDTRVNGLNTDERGSLKGRDISLVSKMTGVCVTFRERKESSARR